MDNYQKWEGIIAFPNVCIGIGFKILKVEVQTPDQRHHTSPTRWRCHAASLPRSQMWEFGLHNIMVDLFHDDSNKLWKNMYWFESGLHNIMVDLFHDDSNKLWKNMYWFESGLHNIMVDLFHDDSNKLWKNMYWFESGLHNILVDLFHVDSNKLRKNMYWFNGQALKLVPSAAFTLATRSSGTGTR